MTRDRLTDLKLALGDDPQVVFNVEDNANSMSGFYQEVTSIQNMIEKMNSYINQMKKIHSSILLSTETKETKQQLEDLMITIKKSANQVKSRLKEMQSNIDSMDSCESAEYRIRKTQHSMLSQKFITVMTLYNTTQSDYRERCKASIQRLYEVIGRSTTNQELEEMLESEDSAVFTQGILPNSKQAKQTLADIEARHEDIIKLEKSIRELHDLFTDMALIVEQQGEMVDRIEYHVTSSKNYTDKGLQETHKAVIYQKKARHKKTILIVCICVVLLVIITITALV